MSSLSVILRHPDRLKKLARDLVEHYEALCSENPDVAQKAMVVCSDRKHAYELWKEIVAFRPDWAEARRFEDNSALTPEQPEELVELPKVNIVATRGEDDEKELYDLCGSKEYRKMLDKQFKNNDSNFKIAVVVDMWITGFDAPSLSVMYIDKPLQKHTPVQIISRVNRVFEGKDKGLVVAYIGIKENMEQAIKQYGDGGGSPVDELVIMLGIFHNHLAMVDDLFVGFDASKYFAGEPFERLKCLNDAAEFAQQSKENETRFMGLSRILKSAYALCFSFGELTSREINLAQFYLAIRSLIYKQTKGVALDAETMNAVVEEMVRKAISCTGKEVSSRPSRARICSAMSSLPISTSSRCQSRSLTRCLNCFASPLDPTERSTKQKPRSLTSAFARWSTLTTLATSLSSPMESSPILSMTCPMSFLGILRDLEEDKGSFEKPGISFEGKAFYDILVKVRDDHGSPYEEEKCWALAKQVEELVDDKDQYADWATRNDIKSQLSMDLTILLYNNGYPPEWDEEVFEKVMEQAENIKSGQAYI